jgi:hypothetical protein
MEEEVAILASIIYCASSKKPSMKERNLCLLASRMAWKHITSSCWVCTTLSPLSNLWCQQLPFLLYISCIHSNLANCLVLGALHCPHHHMAFSASFLPPLYKAHWSDLFWVFLSFTHCSKITYPLCKIMKTTRLWNMLGTCHFIVCPFCCQFRKFWLTLPESPPKFLICTLLGTMAYTQHVL